MGVLGTVIVISVYCRYSSHNFHQSQWADPGTVQRVGCCKTRQLLLPRQAGDLLTLGHPDTLTTWTITIITLHCFHFTIIMCSLSLLTPSPSHRTLTVYNITF